MTKVIQAVGIKHHPYSLASQSNHAIHFERKVAHEPDEGSQQVDWRWLTPLVSGAPALLNEFCPSQVEFSLSILVHLKCVADVVSGRFDREIRLGYSRLNPGFIEITTGFLSGWLFFWTIVDVKCPHITDTCARYWMGDFEYTQLDKNM